MSILKRLASSVGKTLAGTALDLVDIPGPFDDAIKDSLKSVFLGTKDAQDDELAHAVVAQANNPEVAAQIHQATLNAQMAREQLASDERQHERETKLKRDLAQNETNQMIADSSDKFKSYFRPASGWICNLGLLYTFFLRPIANGIISFFDTTANAPPIDTSELMILLFGLLGIGTWRTVDKMTAVKGDDDQH